MRTAAPKLVGAGDRRRKLEQFNQMTREANKGGSGSRPHRAAWGVDQRQFSSEEMKRKQVEIEQLRSKRRSERQPALLQGRTRIGLDLIPDFKYPTTTTHTSQASTPPHHHLTKEASPEVLLYMQEKRRRMQLEAKRKDWEAQKLEERREEALKRLQEVQSREVRKATKSKRKRKKGKRLGKEGKSADVHGEKNLYKKLRDLLKSKAQLLRDTALPLPPAPAEESKSIDRRTQLYEKLEQLSLQLAHTRVLFSQSSEPSKPTYSVAQQTAAARLIQRHVRLYLATKKTALIPAKATGERTFQLSEVEAQAEKEKDPNSDLSLKSFGSFLDKGENLEEGKRPVDSLDFLAKEREIEGGKTAQMERFKQALEEHYEELSQREAQSPEQPAMPPNSPEEPEFLTTEEEALSDLLLTPDLPSESPRLTLGETGGSPNDSSLELLGEALSKEPGLRLADLVGDSARSLTDMFEPKMRFEEEVEEVQFKPTSLRIPGRGRLALDLGRVAAMVSADVLDSSPSIGSLVRGGPESPEVLSYRDTSAEFPTQWNSALSSQVDHIVSAILEQEMSNLLPLISPYITLPSPSPVDPTSDFILVFLDLLVSELQPYEDVFMQHFSQPREVSCMETLAFAAEAKLGTVKEREVEVLVPEQVFERVCERLNVDESSLLAPYCRLMVDIVNECLNVLRPESTKGLAPPWRTGTRDFRHYPSLLSLFYEVRDLALAWSQAQVGQIMLPDAPAAAQIKEERLATQLLRDVSSSQILVEDGSWTDYELEELQVKLDVADVALEQLLGETLALLSV